MTVDLDAAERIESLQGTIGALCRENLALSVMGDAMAEALEPFAIEYDHIAASGSRRLADHEYAPYCMLMGHLRKARAALTAYRNRAAQKE
jgi:hypothetical protein